MESLVPLHAAGHKTQAKLNGVLTETHLVKRWRIRTTNANLHRRLLEYQETPLPTDTPVQHVRGKYGKLSAEYPDSFTKQIWIALANRKDDNFH